MRLAKSEGNRRIGKMKRLRRASALSIGLAATISLLPAPAAATVYQIGKDGNVGVCDRDASGLVSCASAAQAVAAPAEAAPEVPAMAITTIAQPNVPSDFRAPLIDAATGPT